MNEDIFFSIIVPTYNRANLIAATIRTLQEQHYSNYEIIVVDDGSTDNTEEVVKSVADSRTAYYKKNNAERAAARNYGVKVAKGDYINFFDSDDLARPGHLAEAAALIKKRNRPEYFHLGYGWLDGEGNKIKKDSFFQDDTLNKMLVNGNILSCNGVFLRRDIASKHPFNEDRDLSASEDYELWLRLAARYPLYHSNAITSDIVEHDARSVRKMNGDKLIKRFELLQAYVLQDGQVLEYYGKDLQMVKLDLSTYLALHLSEVNELKMKSIGYLGRSMLISPRFIFTKRFLATIRNIVFRW